MAGDPGFEVYQDNADEWRWRLVAVNGEVIADSGGIGRSKARLAASRVSKPPCPARVELASE